MLAVQGNVYLVVHALNPSSVSSGRGDDPRADRHEKSAGFDIFKSLNDFKELTGKASRLNRYRLLYGFKNGVNRLFSCYADGMARNARKSRAERTRGFAPWSPDNGGYALKTKEKRTLVDLFEEHRIEMLAEARELGLSGATEAEAGEHFGVHACTIRKWRSKDPAFDAALRLGEDLADGRVKASLLSRALGYSYRAEEVRVIGGHAVKVPVLKHEPPNVTAQIFWLKNRQPDQWRDTQDHKVDGAIRVEDTDPRKLAMAMLAIIREAVHAPKTIEAEAGPGA